MVPSWSPKYYVPHYNKDPSRHHNFDNHPYVDATNLEPHTLTALLDPSITHVAASVQSKSFNNLSFRRHIRAQRTT